MKYKAATAPNGPDGPGADMNSFPLRSISNDPTLSIAFYYEGNEDSPRLMEVGEISRLVIVY